MTESKHYSVDFMCISYLLYFSPHLLMTKSKNILDQEHQGGPIRTAGGLSKKNMLGGGGGTQFTLKLLKPNQNCVEIIMCLYSYSFLTVQLTNNH